MEFQQKVMGIKKLLIKLFLQVVKKMTTALLGLKCK